MKKYILIITLLIQVLGSNVIHHIEKMEDLKGFIRKNTHEQVKMLSPKRFNKIVKRYNTVILTHSRTYSVQPELIANIIKTESGFRWWAKSHKDALGPMQVVAKHHSQHLYNISPKLAKELLNAKNTNELHEKYLKQIGHGCHVGIRVFSIYLRRFRRVDLALMAYNRGPGSKKFKKALRNSAVLRNDDYVKRVMGR